MSTRNKQSSSPRTTRPSPSGGPVTTLGDLLALPPQQQEFRRLLNRPVDINRRYKAGLRLTGTLGRLNTLYGIVHALNGAGELPRAFRGFKLVNTCAPVGPFVSAFGIPNDATACQGIGTYADAIWYDQYRQHMARLAAGTQNTDFAMATGFRRFGAVAGSRWKIYHTDATNNGTGITPLPWVQRIAGVAGAPLGRPIRRFLANHPALDPNDRRALAGGSPEQVPIRSTRPGVEYNRGGQAVLEAGSRPQVNRKPDERWNPQPKTEFFPISRLPDKGVNERKVRAPARSVKAIKSAFNALDIMSEAGDALDCFAKSIKGDPVTGETGEELMKKYEKAWQRLDRAKGFNPSKGIQGGQYSISDAGWQSVLVYDYADQIDLEALAICLAKNEAEDQFIGRQQAIKDLYRARKLPKTFRAAASRGGRKRKVR